MPHFHDNALIGAAGAAGAGGAVSQISRSLRFNSSDLANLSRAIASAGNRKTWTWAGWVKRSGFGALNILFSSGVDSSNNFRFSFTAGDQLQVANEVTATTTTFRVTTAVYRDPSAWMHLVLAVDTTQATAAERVKLYVNGAEVTVFSSTTDPALNADLNCNAAGTFYVGRNFQSTYLNAYLADVHFISGSALTPSSFGQFDATTGEWVPITYGGSYGTNGHKLTFSDNSAATAATLGADTSGGGNNFTPNNLLVTAGVNNDSLVDSPSSYGTDTGAGGEVRGNYATFNSSSIGTGITITDGGLRVASTSSGQALSTIALPVGQVSYAECTVNNAGSGCAFGISTWALAAAQGSYVMKRFDGSEHTGGMNGATISGSTAFSLVANDVLGVAYDHTTRVLTFYKNGVSQWSLNTNVVSTPLFFSYRGDPTNAGGASINFGQRPWAYTPPAGAKALCDTNLPAPTIVKPSTVMDVVTYTGTGASLTPTSSLGFSPDLVWIKSRNTGNDHGIYDTVRGATLDLASNLTSAESTQSQSLTAFNSNGFTVGSLAKTGALGNTYVAWCWDAGASTSTNNAGSISSQVRANASAGCSIVTFTSTGFNATVGHGLGVAPSLVILKKRPFAASWPVWHSALAATEYLLLNSAAAKATGATYWNSTAPTSGVFSIGTNTDVGGGDAMVAYCFAPVAGYSAFGSYGGSGSTDGTFVYTGFRPRYVLIKGSSVASGWQIYDAVRDDYNQANNDLNSGSAGLENGDGVSGGIDILSNGFKLRSGDSWLNSGNYIYAAFAESPFQSARAR